MVQMLTSQWGTVLVLEAEDFGSNPDFVIYYLCDLQKKLLSLFEPQFPHLLIRDDDDGGGDCGDSDDGYNDYAYFLEL